MSSPAALLAALALIPAWAGAKSAGKTAKKEPKAMEWKADFCPVTEPAVLVAKTREDWERLWKRIGKAAPEADLEKNFAVAVFLGTRNTGGYRVAFETAPGAGSVVRYRVKEPSGMMVIQVLTQPYAVKLFPKSGGEVKVEAAKE